MIRQTGSREAACSVSGAKNLLWIALPGRKTVHLDYPMGLARFAESRLQHVAEYSDQRISFRYRPGNLFAPELAELLKSRHEDTPCCPEIVRRKSPLNESREAFRHQLPLSFKGHDHCCGSYIFVRVAGAFEPHLHDCFHCERVQLFVRAESDLGGLHPAIRSDNYVDPN